MTSDNLQLSYHPRFHMPCHAADDLIYAWLAWRGQCDHLGFARLNFDLPINIRLIFFVEMSANICVELHNDQIVFYKSIVSYIKCDFFTRRDRELVWRKCKIGYFNIEFV